MEKTIAQRVHECVDIRGVLTRTGAACCEANRARVAEACNSFVRNGTGATFDLPVDGSVVARVQLVLRACTKSGVTLIRSISPNGRHR